MARGMRRDRKKERRWRRHVGDQRRSGMSVREYCREHKLSESGFHWWKRELARRDVERRVGASETHRQAVGGRVGPRGSGPPRHVAFAEVEVVGADGDRRTSSQGSDGPPIEVCLSHGRTIRVHRGFDEPTFVRVVALLEGGSPC